MARHSGGSYSKTRSIQAEKHPQLDQSPQQNPQQPQRITQMSQTQMSPFSDAPTTSSSSTSKCFCGGGQKDYNLRVAGPSMGGKTSLIRYLQHGQFTAETAPTNGTYYEFFMHHATCSCKMLMHRFRNGSVACVLVWNTFYCMGLEKIS